MIQETDEQLHDQQPQEPLVQEQDEQAPRRPHDRQPHEAFDQPEAEQAHDTQPREPRYYPSSKFDLGSLRELFPTNQVEFGRREIALRLIHQKKSLAFINQRLRDLGANILFQDEYDDITLLVNKSRYICNFTSLKEELN